MPSAQVIDLNPLPRTETTALEKTLTAFSQRNRANQVDQEETDALKSIYGQYQQDGKNLEETIKAIQTKPGLSPTTRVNTVKQLLEFQKHNGELQEKAQKAQEKIEKKTSNQAILADLEQKRGLSPGSLNAYADDPKMAEQITRPAKEGKKTQASQPLDEDQLKRIEHTLANPAFKDASSSEKNLMLIKNGVSKENSKAVIDPFIEENKLKNERNSVITKKQAENDIAFAEEQGDKYQSLVAREGTVEAADALNEEGVTGQPWDHAMQAAGLLQYTSEGYREFASYAKEMVKNANIKSIIGSQISAMEFGFFRDATISERFSKEANRQIIKKEKLAIRYDKLYSDITNKLIEANNGQIPEGLQRKVNQEFEQQSKKISKELKETVIDYDAIQNVPEGKVLMFDKKRRPLHVPANEVEKYSKPPYGASLS